MGLLPLLLCIPFALLMPESPRWLVARRRPEDARLAISKLAGIGLSGYREMLKRDFREIPDLHFDIQLLVCEPPRIASRLGFNCTPKGSFLGLEVIGRKVSFAENVFYKFDERKISAVWSIIDKAAIERQLWAGGRVAR